MRVFFVLSEQWSNLNELHYFNGHRVTWTCLSYPEYGGSRLIATFVLAYLPNYTEAHPRRPYLDAALWTSDLPSCALITETQIIKDRKIVIPKKKNRLYLLYCYSLILILQVAAICKVCVYFLFLSEMCPCPIQRNFHSSWISTQYIHHQLFKKSWSTVISLGLGVLSISIRPTRSI
jgi:hypothetical protein